MKKHALPCLNASHYAIDTHCHLDMDDYKEDLEPMLMECQAHGIKKIISIGIDVKSSLAAIELARTYPFIKASIGVHPSYVENIKEETYTELRNIAKDNQDVVIGFGEIGLDYAKLYAPKEVQQRHFIRQLELAQELNLPIIIHCRDAQDDIVDLVKKHCTLPVRGVIHCFSGNIDFAKEVLAMGFHISIPGIVTFKNAVELQEVARFVPLERLLIETDGPFLAPMPYRGKRNRPDYVLYTANKIAELKGITLEEVAQYSSQNAEELFSL